MAHKYQLQVGEIYFNDDEIISIPENNSVDIAGNELSIDECAPVVFVVYYDAQSFAPWGYDIAETADGKVFCTNKQYTNTKISTIERGSELKVFVDSIQKATYYVDLIRRISEYQYEISCISGIGLLENKYHAGGMYANEPFLNIVAEIVGGEIGELQNGLYPITSGAFTCFIQKELGITTVSGRLPYDTSRNNLHRMMLAYGATLTKSESGDITLAYLLYSDEPPQIDESITYDRGSVNFTQPASVVQVKEHTFIARPVDEEVVVFDTSMEGISADNTLVLFDEPLHDIRGIDGLTLIKSNCNYGVVSGLGKLVGKKYTHSTKLVQKGVSIAKDNVVSVNDLELITAANSKNVLDRLFEYYTKSSSSDISFVMDNEKCGRQYSFVDAFGNDQVGYITKMDISSSGIRKASATLVTGYKPIAQGNNFNSYELLTGTGEWTIPEGITRFRAVLVGGGHGADGAYNGENGQNGSVSQEDRWTRYYDGANGGRGGKGSKASTGGKVYTVDFEDQTPGSVINFSCGVGGAGGERNGGTGLAGGETTFGNYSSENGSSILSGIINLFTGEIYAQSGLYDGIDGADGGSVPYSDFTNFNPYAPENGDSVEYNGEIWNGGTGGHSQIYGVSGTYVGGAGGGAAYSRPGNDDAPPRGGNGADAQAFPSMSGYGNGCNGANGGGGGGAGGYDVSNTWFRGGAGGSGGLASVAQSGGDGCVIIYY